MTVENEVDLKALLRIGKIVAECLHYMAEKVEPGMTTKQLDDLGAAFLQRHGARSAPILTYRYPGYTCISLNDEAAHGIPGERVIREGDIINIDVSAELEGYYADNGASFPVGQVSDEAQRLLAATRFARDEAIKAAVAGARINTVGKTVEKIARKYGYTVIRDLPGHGIGRRLHEKPSVPNYYTKRANERFTDGLVVTIEPFLTTGKGQIFTADDGWTLKTSDGALAAQYEHTIVINGDSPIILTKAG